MQPEISEVAAQLNSVSIHLVRRVPRVLRNLVRLVGAIHGPGRG